MFEFIVSCNSRARGGFQGAILLSWLACPPEKPVRHKEAGGKLRNVKNKLKKHHLFFLQ